MEKTYRQTTTLPWWTYVTLAIMSLLFIFCFSTTTSPFYKDCSFWGDGDSGVFQALGLCLLQGGTPYIDLFDHKGPLLFFIQAAGLAISLDWGLALLQSVALFVTLLFCHKTALLLTQKTWQAFAVDLLVLYTLLCFYYRGNRCEEWSLPFLCIPIYIYIKSYCSRQSVHAVGSLITGLCLGAIAMIRINNAAPALGFILCYFIELIRQKQWRTVLNNCLFILLGFITIILPCCLFFYIKAGTEGVGEMLFGTFMFNLIYITKVNRDYINIYLYYLPAICFIIITIISARTQYRKLAYACLVSYVITLFAIGFNLYYHYLITIIPLFAISLCLLFQYLNQIYKSKPKACPRIRRWLNWHNCTYIILIIALVTCFNRYSYQHLDLFAVKILGRSKSSPTTLDFHRFLETIPPEQRSDIYNVYALPPFLFVEQHIVQCNRFFVLRHVVLSPELALYEQQHGIREKQPHWIFITPNTNYLDEPTLLFVKEHYTLADSINSSNIDNTIPVIYCYKRNF